MTNVGTGSTGAVNVGGGANDVVIGSTNGVTILANSGHLRTVGTTPTVNSCGGTGATIAGTDVAGTVSDGTGSYTTCSINFATAWANAPNCIVTQKTGTDVTFIASATTTRLTISGLTNTTGRSFTWICME